MLILLLSSRETPSPLEHTTLLARALRRIVGDHAIAEGSTVGHQLLCQCSGRGDCHHVRFSFSLSLSLISPTLSGVLLHVAFRLSLSCKLPCDFGNPPRQVPNPKASRSVEPKPEALCPEPYKPQPPSFACKKPLTPNPTLDGKPRSRHLPSRRGF